MCGGYGISILGLILAIYMYNTSPKAVLLFTIIYTCIYISLREIKFSFYFYSFFFASVCFCLSSLGALRIQAYLYGAWQRQLRIASEFTEGELLPLVSTLYNHNVCIAEIVNLVFMKLFFPFLLGGGGEYVVTSLVL